jgi:hypothetical protein
VHHERGATEAVDRACNRLLDDRVVDAFAPIPADRAKVAARGAVFEFVEIVVERRGLLRQTGNAEDRLARDDSAAIVDQPLNDFLARAEERKRLPPLRREDRRAGRRIDQLTGRKAGDENDRAICDARLSLSS